MQQTFAIHDSAEEATDYAIKQAGGEYKRVAAMLWPGVKPATAYARLKACLNEAKPEKLTFDEHLAIARFIGSFEVVYYACMDTDHERPRAVNRDQRVATLQEQFIDSATNLQKMVAEIQRLTGDDSAVPRMRVVGA